MSQVEADLEALCKLARELGATNAVSFSARGVAVDERVRLKCLVPICDDYGLNLMCPPHIMSVQEFRDVLTKYDWAILIQIIESIPAEMKKEIKQAEDVAALYKNAKFLEIYSRSFDPIKLQLQRVVHKVEAQAYVLGYRFATGFTAGSCELCPECVACSNSQEPCRHPFRARPSMEAVGIDVFKTAENVGLPFDIPSTNKTVWNGLVLVT